MGDETTLRLDAAHLLLAGGEEEEEEEEDEHDDDDHDGDGDFRAETLELLHQGRLFKKGVSLVSVCIAGFYFPFFRHFILKAKSPFCSLRGLLQVI